MATKFEEVKEPYEMLFRFAGGVPKGGHVQYIERLIVDGVVRSEQIGNAEPLDLDGFPTSAIISDTTRDALAEVQRLHAELETTKADAGKAANEAEQTLTALEQSLATVTQQKMEQATRAATAEGLLADTQQTLSTVVSEAQARIAELEGMVARKRQEEAA